MAVTKLTKQDLKVLRCCKCEGYLSVPPITSNSEGFHCGRCVPLGEYVRLTIYEALSKYAQFPCIFDSRGCNHQVKYATAQSHESSCEFRITKCPIESCQISWVLKHMEKHLIADHSALLSNNTKLSIPQKKDVAMFHILDRDGMKLLLQIRTRFGENSGLEFDLALRYFTKPPNLEQYTYSVRITSPDNSKSLSLDNHHVGAYEPKWNYPKQKVVSLDFNTLRMLLDSSDFYFDINLDKIAQIGPVGATKQTPNNARDERNQDSASSGPIKREEATATASDVKLKDDESSFLDDLECIICKEYLKPPIYMCKTGHSICSKCKQSLSICPICQDKYEGARNYQLEKLASRLEYTADKHELGGEWFSNRKEVPARDPHLDNVFLCPLADQKCSWRGALEQVYPHSRRDHHLCTWLKFNQKMFFNLYSKWRSYRLITEFDNRVFIVTIIVDVWRSLISIRLGDFGLDKAAEPLYNYVFYIYPDEMAQKEVSFGVCHSFRPFRAPQQINVDFGQNKEKLYFRIDVSKSRS